MLSRILGRRDDGVLLIDIGARQCVLLARGHEGADGRVSPPFDELASDRYGVFRDVEPNPMDRRTVEAWLAHARSTALRHFELDFNPDQPRAEDGKWSSGGGGGRASSGPRPRSNFPTLMASIAQKDGGFTYHVATGAQPKSGFALSINKDQESVHDAQKMTLNDLWQFAKRNWDTLKQPDAFLGGWHNPEDDKVYLDISRVFKSEADAKTLGCEHKQLAYFDLAKGESVPINC